MYVTNILYLVVQYPHTHTPFQWPFSPWPFSSHNRGFRVADRWSGAFTGSIQRFSSAQLRLSRLSNKGSYLPGWTSKRLLLTRLQTLE